MEHDTCEHPGAAGIANNNRQQGSEREKGAGFLAPASREPRVLREPPLDVLIKQPDAALGAPRFKYFGPTSADAADTRRDLSGSLFSGEQQLRAPEGPRGCSAHGCSPIPGAFPACERAGAYRQHLKRPQLLTGIFSPITGVFLITLSRK